MRIKLTDGRAFRVTFRHLTEDAATDERREEAVKRLSEIERAMGLPYAQLIGLTDCFIEEVVEGRPLTRDADPLGTAVCSAHDTFDKARGRKISLARALVVLTPDRTIRKQFWDAYAREGNRWTI